MESSIDIPTIGLTLSACDSQIEIATTENDEASSIVKNRIGRQGLEQYFKNFTVYITGEHKGKASAPANYMKKPYGA